MNPITHFLISWTVADRLPLEARDRELATWCGVLPDADGVGILADSAFRLTGTTGSSYYTLYHHSLFHGLPAAVAFPALLCFFGVRRFRVFVSGFLLFHLHLLCDLVGSRGGPDDIWPIPYLAPLSNELSLSWQGQWLLNGWQNILLTILLLGGVFASAAIRGRSPVTLFSEKAGGLFVATVRGRLGRKAEGCDGN